MSITEWRFNVSARTKLEGHDVEPGQYWGFQADRPSANHPGGFLRTYHMDVPVGALQNGAVVADVKRIDVTDAVLSRTITLS